MTVGLYSYLLDFVCLIFPYRIFWFNFFSNFIMFYITERRLIYLCVLSLMDTSARKEILNCGKHFCKDIVLKMYSDSKE